MSAANELNDRQSRYDLLHHKKRSAEIAAMPETTWLERELFRQSERWIADPNYRSRSVDLSDAHYLRELDEFEVAQNA